MDALELILLIAGFAASLVVAAGCVMCLIVWLGGQGNERPREVCARSDES